MFGVVLLLVLSEGGNGFMPVMRVRIFSMASNSFCCVSGLPLMAFPRFLIALVIQSVLLIVGVGKVWCRKVNVSVRLTAPVSITALMH